MNLIEHLFRVHEDVFHLDSTRVRRNDSFCLEKYENVLNLTKNSNKFGEFLNFLGFFKIFRPFLCLFEFS